MPKSTKLPILPIALGGGLLLLILGSKQSVNNEVSKSDSNPNPQPKPNPNPNPNPNPKPIFPFPKGMVLDTNKQGTSPPCSEFEYFDEDTRLCYAWWIPGTSEKLVEDKFRELIKDLPNKDWNSLCLPKNGNMNDVERQILYRTITLFWPQVKDSDLPPVDDNDVAKPNIELWKIKLWRKVSKIYSTKICNNPE